MTERYAIFQDIFKTRNAIGLKMKRNGKKIEKKRRDRLE